MTITVREIDVQCYEARVTFPDWPHPQVYDGLGSPDEAIGAALRETWLGHDGPFLVTLVLSEN